VEVLSERGDLPYDLVEDAMAALEDDDASEKKLFDQALAAYSDFTIPDEVINRTEKEQAGWPEDLGDLPGSAEIERIASVRLATTPSGVSIRHRMKT